MKLLLVESPHKAKTIGQWLDKREWKLLPTIGHIKNLPAGEYGVDKENNYQGKWIIEKDKKEILQNIKQAIAQCSEVYIATDDDREGERIAFDLAEHFKLKEYYRILFHEITRKGVLNSLHNAAYIDEHKVRSQMTRRIIDRTIGYPFSTALRWYMKTNKMFNDFIIKKFGLGRVSALALAIIVRNQRIVDRFVPQKYRKLYIEYQFKEKDGSIIKFTATDESKFREEHHNELSALYDLCNDPDIEHRVEDYEGKDEPKYKMPPPPLKTVTLINGVNFLYKYRPKVIEKAFQKLYNGVKILNPESGRMELVGLITYPRTDSVYLSDTVTDEIIDCLSGVYSKEYIVREKRVYKQNNTKAQEAHESIRPTNFSPGFFPKRLKQYLSEEEFKIYEFIFYRTLATQMKDSVYDKSKITINVKDHLFTAYANKCIFPGWEKLGNIVKKHEDRKDGKIATLPKDLHIDDVIKPFAVVLSKDLTDNTPPRIGQGRFVKILESKFIGKPSTIPSVSNQLEERGCIQVTENMIEPTDLGYKVVEILEEKASWLIDEEHGKAFEEKLDEIEEGGDNIELIREYDDLTEQFMQSINFEYKESSKNPEQWMVDKAVKLSEKNGIELDITLLNDKKKLATFIQKQEKVTYVGKCPLCKKEVHDRDKSFSCKNMECKFVIWKNSLKRTFDNFKKGLSEDRYKEFIEQLLKTKKIWVDDLWSEKKKKTFAAYIVLKESQSYAATYELGLSFPKAKVKTMDEKYLFNFDDNLMREMIFEGNQEPVENQYINTNNINRPGTVVNKTHSKEPIIIEYVGDDDLNSVEIPTIL